MLCLLSSANYVINDIIDRKKDALNPEKKTRPLASGEISVVSAFVFAVILLLVSLALGYLLDPLFFVMLLLLFGFTQAYGFYFKHIAILDVTFISLNFVFRAVSGAFLIDVEISKWLVICTFFFALFLAVGKRTSEYLFLGDKAKEHREVYLDYSASMLRGMLYLSSTILLVAYLLFSIFSEHENLYYSLPLVIYPIFRFMHLIDAGSSIPRHLENFYKDKGLVLGALCSLLCIFLLLYL